MTDRVSVEQLRKARDSASSIVDTCQMLLDKDSHMDPKKFQDGISHAICGLAAVSMVILSERIMILRENEDA